MTDQERVKIIKQLDVTKDNLITFQMLLANYGKRDDEIGKKIQEIHNMIKKLLP